MEQILNVVVLAAGQGKRMNSSLPKVLHPVSMKPMLQHVIETALALDPDKLVVVHGHGGEQVQNVIGSMFGDQIFWAHQEDQLGTGHALKCALNQLDSDGVTLVLYGDVPLISLETLQKMLEKYQNSVVMLTDEIDNPAGYGRIVRNNEFAITGIVEEKDASQSERLIREINTGFYVLPNNRLGDWLNRLSNQNTQKEYYLTDVIAMAYADGVDIDCVLAPHHYEVLGVNNKLQLEQLERIYQLNQANKLLEQGVTLFDRHRIDIRGTLAVGRDCVIDINCIFEGNVQLGSNVSIGTGCTIKNAVIANNVSIKAYSIIEDTIIDSDTQVGPFARLRPGAELGRNVHVGNFVEIKKSKIGEFSKVNHLTYIGDAEIGEQVNVGAGSVTCNYDGKNKFKTVIGNNVFIGSGTMLVAPVTVHDGSLIGAGSVITTDTPEEELTLARAKQVTVYGWKKRNK